MANNVQFSAGTADGAIFATDDIGGVHYPYGKIGIGADDTFTILTGNTGTVGAGTLRVTLATDVALPAGTNAIGKLAANSGVDIGDVDVTSSALPTGASTSAKQDTMITALQLIDNIVLAEDAAHVSGDVGVQALTVRQDTAAALGQTDGDYQPLVTDSTGRLHVNVGNTVTVGSHAVTNAGTFVVQENGAALTALQLIDNLVLLEDVAHSTGDPGIQMLAIRDDTLNIRSGTENDYEPLHTDANGALWVRHTSDAITVSSHAVTNAGTFAVQVDGNALTALQLIDDAVFAEDVAAQAADKGISVLAVRRDTASTMVGADNDYTNLIVDGSGRLHVNVGNTVTVASHAVTNAGTFATQIDGAALTALQLIDDVVFAEDAAASSGEKGISNLAVRVDTPNVALTNADADYGHMTINKLGSLRTAYPEDDLATAATKHTYKYYTNAGAVTDGIIWSPAAGARWFLTSLTINVSAAATVTIEDDVAAGDVVRFKFELAANSGVSIPLNPPMFSGEDAADLLVTTTAGNVYITAVGYEI